MSPRGKKILDEFSHLPNPDLRWRYRLKKAGVCVRCGKGRASEGNNCEACRAYFRGLYTRTKQEGMA